MTLEVGLHRFKKSKNGGREVGKNVGGGKGRRKSESDVGVGVTLEVGLHRLKKS